MGKGDEAASDAKGETDLLIDLTKHFIKPDQFDGIHILDNKFEKVEGAPNFRQVPGFPIYGTGQPTKDGLIKILKKAKNGEDRQTIFWFLMRQEPVVYVNGYPFALRHQDKPHGNLEIMFSPTQIKSIGDNLAQTIRERVNQSGTQTLKIHVDKEFSENP